MKTSKRALSARRPPATAASLRLAALALAAALGLAVSVPAVAGELAVGVLNVAAEDSSAERVASEVLGAHPADVWALTAHNQTEIFRRAAAGASGHEWEWIESEEGGRHRNALFYDTEVLELVESFGLAGMAVEIDDRPSVPLAARFRLRDGGGELLVVSNDALGAPKRQRADQLEVLRDWVRGRTLPVVLVGSFELGQEADAQGPSEDSAELTAGGVYRWVRPEPLAATRCGGDEIETLAFLGGGAQGVRATAEVLHAGDGEYCRGGSGMSDHRPVIVRLELGE